MPAQSQGSDASPDMEIPEQIEIKPSSVDSEAMGLWCSKLIPLGTKFGPFMGNKVQEATDDMDPSYVWEIVDLETKEFLFYIDATDPGMGNWMRYINCARYFEEQNIVSEQEGIDIVYRAIKDINPGEELLTWYEKAPLRKRRGKKVRKTFRSSVSSRRRALSRNSSTESQQQQQLKKTEPEEGQEKQLPEPISDEILPLPTPSSSSASLTFLDPQQRETEDLSAASSAAAAAVVTETTMGEHGQPLRRSKRKCPKKSSIQDDDFIYGSDNDQDDEEDDEDDVDDEEDDINEDDAESFNGSIPDVFHSDNIEIDTSFPAPDSGGFYQFEVKPYHNVKSRLGRKVFQCDICSGVYRHTFSLKRHYIRNHINYKYVSKTDRLNCNVNYNEVDNVSNASSLVQEKEELPSRGSLSDREETGSDKTPGSLSPSLGDASESNLLNVAENGKADKKDKGADELESGCKEDNKLINGSSLPDDMSLDSEKIERSSSSREEEKAKEISAETLKENIENNEAEIEGTQGGETDAKSSEIPATEKGCEISRDGEQSTISVETKYMNQMSQDSEASVNSQIAHNGSEKCENQSQSDADNDNCKHGACASVVPCSDCKTNPSVSQAPPSECKVSPGDCKKASSTGTSESAVPSSDSKEGQTQCKVPSVDSKKDSSDSPPGEQREENSETSPGDCKDGCKVPPSDHTECEKPPVECKNSCKELPSDRKENCKETSIDFKESSNVPSSLGEKISCESPSTNCKSECSHTHCKLPSETCKEQLTENNTDSKLSEQSEVRSEQDNKEAAEKNSEKERDVKADNSKPDAGDVKADNPKPDAGHVNADNPKPDTADLKEDLKQKTDGKLESETLQTKVADRDSLPDCPQQQCIPTQDKVVPSEHTKDNIHEPDTSVSSKIGILMPGVFRCNICEALFDTIPELKVHLQHHPDVPSSKKFACNQCDMKFSHKQNLMRHQAVHSGTKPYVCKYCGKKFPTVTNLKRHERLHQGRRYSCECCGATFTQTGDLKKHFRKVHPESFYECGFCCKYYTGQEQLVEHLELIHPGEDLGTNKKELSMRIQVFKVDSKKDRAESMRMALAKPGHRFACTVCKKRFHDYANMCRHRRLAHQKQVLLSRRLTQSPQITMEALYGSFTDGDCVRPGGEFDFPSQYYANVARNIAENLSTYLEGKQEELERPDNHIKWKEPEPEKEITVVKSVEKKTKNTGTAETVSMMKYNFPRGFQIKSTTELWKRKVNYFLKSPEKLLEEWVDGDVHPDAEMGESSGTVEMTILDIKTEMPNEGPLPSPAHGQDSSKTGMKSPPPLQRKPNVAASGPAPAPAQPPKPQPPIRVPILHTCSICRCVLHNYGLYRQHMLHKHKIQIPAQTPDLLDRIPGLQPVAVSVASAVDSEQEGGTPRTAVATATATVTATSSNSTITQAPSLRITANLQSIHRISSNANPACPMSPPAHSSCARSPPAHCSSSPPHSHYPLAKTPPAHLSSAVSPRAHSTMITIPSNHSEQPLDLSSPKSRYPPVNPFDPVPTGAINLTLAKTGTVSEEVSKMDPQNNDEPVDLTGGNSQSGEPQTCTTKSKDRENADSATQVDQKPNSENSAADELLTNKDKTPDKKKKKNTKQLCLACYEEFEDLPALYKHQESDHATLDCRHGSRLETRPGMKALCCYVPNAVGLLNVCASQLPEQKENVASKAVSCTKCNTTYPEIADLHKHIIDYCANDGKPQEIHYGYIWIYRGKIRAKKRRKYRRPQNTPRKHSSVFDGGSHRRRGLFDSAEDEEGGRKRRRGMYELMYNPLNHIRRREMAEIVDTQSCRGCGEQFKTISMLERHIPVCSHKDRLREIHVGKSQQEEDEDSDAYDPSKHMCIYCERLFTYLGMLRNHIFDICPVRKDFVEQGELLDDEWEQDIISRAGPRETTLSRQSSMSSLVGIAGEDGEEEETSRSKRGKKRKKRRHKWGYRVKNGERRQSKNSEEGDSSMSPGGGFALHDESSNSMPGKDDLLASNSAEGNRDDAGKTTVLEEKAHFSSVRTKSEGIDTSQTKEFGNSATREDTSHDPYDEDTENSDNEEKTSPVKAEPEVAEKLAKGSKRKVSVDSRKSPMKKIKVEEKPVEKQAQKTPKKTPSKAPKVTPQPKAKSPVKKTPVGKTTKSVKTLLEDSGVGDEDVDSDDEDVALSMLVASPKSDSGSLPSPKSVSKKTPAKSKTTNKKATVGSAKKTPQSSTTKATKTSKSATIPVNKSPTKAKSKSPVKKSPAKSVKKTTKKTEVVKKFITRTQSWAASAETATQLAKSKSVSPTKGKGSATKTKNRSASESKSGGKTQKLGKEKPPSLSSVKKKLKL